MERVDLFKDIAERTGGDIYLGVVGAVRTGKSTFIKKFMELVVLPNIASESERARAQDELPQSAAGRTIMTTEPKFVPNQAISVHVDEGLEVNIRLVDCVGYTVPGAKGYEDENGPRMVYETTEKYSVLRALRAIERSDVVLVVIDGDEGIIEQDKKIAGYAHDAGRAVIIVVNKWDAVEKDEGDRTWEPGQ